jgi:DNA-binding SARP family transcriptional activator
VIGTLCLLDDSHAMVGGQRTDLPDGGLRLLVLLAVADRPLPRRTVARMLWPGHSAPRAAGNLRTMLWRLRDAGCDIVEPAGQLLWLRTGTLVDLRELTDRARRLLGGRPTPADLAPSAWRSTPDLLPGCTDEWLEPERDRLRLLTRAALRATSRYLTAQGRGADAVETALAAIALDPLDEDARHALVAAHLAEDNLVEAHRAITDYRTTTRRELGVDPGHELTGLLRDALLDRPPATDTRQRPYPEGRAGAQDLRPVGVSGTTQGDPGPGNTPFTTSPVE